MYIKMPYNWDLSLLDSLDKMNREDDTIYPVKEIYASDRKSIVGTGRPPAVIPERHESYATHINSSHKKGMKFFYVLNACSMAGQELNGDTQKEIYTHISDLVEAGVDGFIITIPYLAVLIKTWFPKLIIASSVNNQLDSVAKIEQLLYSAPYDEIQFPFTRSRDFPLFREVSNHFPEKGRTALVNESCLPDCAFQRFHQDFYNFLSPEEKKIDFYHLCCAVHKLENPLNVLKSQWIRPEDLCFLKEAGITAVKLAGREKKDSSWLLDLARNYSKGQSTGNIFRFVEKTGLLDMDWKDILGKDLDPCHYIVDSQAMDGFIKPFYDGKVPCVTNKNCSADCKWCEGFMHAVTLPPNRSERLNTVNQLMEVAKSNMYKVV